MNELKDAASPYLIQHAGNPVHWRQWTPAALAEAKRLDKPILLSIGYAACHWCHVMAHESFEDEATARLMNTLFVNVKVDREERPDVDHIYMSALHAFGQRGGWPLTMFLTPDAEPFWGGTYFPKEARHGQPSFADVLRTISTAYRDRPGQVAANIRGIMAKLDAGVTAASPLLVPAEMDQLAARLVEHTDPVNGGMRGAPKFPNPSILEFLWRAGERGVPGCRAHVLLTLARMSAGGIFDHLGGGYARYSTDERWLAPHFEKMLYDNAQLLPLLALAYRATGDGRFAERADETVAWLAREMTGPDGAFHASLDADSEGAEGKFYVWTAAEIVDVLGAEDAALFARAYDVTPGGNWQDPHGGAPVAILNRLDTPPLAPDEEARLPELRHALLARRATRVRPGLDDKILADWNGLMIAGLVDAATALGRPRWIAMAARAHDAIIGSMTYHDGTHRRLAHSRRGVHQVKPGFALDYAAMARAALALAETDVDGPGRERLIDMAGVALDTLFAQHRDTATGLLTMAAADAGDVILRLKPTQDDAIPNAHSVALDALVRLATLTGDAARLAQADALFEAVSGATRAEPIAHVGILNALDLRARGASVVVAGPGRAALRAAALGGSYLTRNVVDLGDASALPPDHPAHAQLAAAHDAAAAFVCRAGACSLPIRDAAALAAELDGVEAAA